MSTIQYTQVHTSSSLAPNQLPSFIETVTFVHSMPLSPPPSPAPPLTLTLTHTNRHATLSECVCVGQRGLTSRSSMVGMRTVLGLFICCVHVAAYVPGELCTNFDVERQRCLKWVSTPSDNVRYSDVQTSKSTTCAVERDPAQGRQGMIACWGDDGERTALSRPNEHEVQFSTIAIGYRHVCGIHRITKHLYCWGRGPAAVVPRHLKAKEFKTLAAGPHDTCATFQHNDSAICFGEHELAPPQRTKFVAAVVPSGELSPAGEGYATEQPFVLRYSQISIGQTFACGVVTGDGGYNDGDMSRDGSVDCWGTTKISAMPNERTMTLPAVLSPPSGIRLKYISSGPRYSCGVTTAGHVRCWGVVPPIVSQAVPADAKGPFISVSVGERHVCARRNEGEVLCFGDNRDGQTYAPKGKFLSVVVGLRHSCGLRHDARVYCWGHSLGYRGMLGPDDTIEERIEMY